MVKSNHYVSEINSNLNDETFYNVMQLFTRLRSEKKRERERKEIDFVENSTSSKGKEDEGERATTKITIN